MDEYKSRLSAYLSDMVREELEKYDGGFTDEWNDQREKNAEVLGYKLSGKSDIKEGATEFWMDMFRPGPIPKKYINQLIKKKGELPSKSHIKKIYRDNGNPSSSQLAKTWKQLQKEKYVRAASGMWRWNANFTGWESITEGGMGILTSDQADVLQGIVMRNKNKNTKAILSVALKSGYFKGVDKKELLGYIDGARQFVKYMKSHPMESVKEATFDSTGIDWSGEMMWKWVSKALKSAGIKELKYTPMKSGWLGGKFIWGGFYQVQATKRKDVLPITVDKKGNIHLNVSPKKFIIGKVGKLPQVVKNLKDFKKSDLDVYESVSETQERDYKAEYKKYGSSTKAKKYRAELNQYNRKKGTYGNGDGKDASHKGGKIAGFEKESTNRGRREKSRLKQEAILKLRQMIREELYNSQGEQTDFKKGDLVKDINPDCPHVGSEGEVTKVGNGTITFKVTNNGKTYQEDDVLEKTVDQMVKLKESINEAVEPQGNMAKIAKIVKRKQASKLGGVMIDMQSASLLMKLWDAVSDKDKEKMNTLNPKVLTTVIKKLWSRVNLKLPM